MPTLVTKIVDPDNGPGTDYLSLSAWQTAKGGIAAGDLVATDSVMQVLCRSTLGTIDGGGCALSGWTTDATHYIEIRAARGHEARKVGIDASRYRITKSAGDANVFLISVNHVRIDGLQVIDAALTGNFWAFRLSAPIGAGGDIRILNCYVQNTHAGAGHSAPLYCDDVDVVLSMKNCILLGGDLNQVGFATCASALIYNCVIYGENASAGINRTAGAVTAKNCAVFNTTNDFNGVITLGNCASDDGDAGATVGPVGGDWANEFVSHATGDLTLRKGGNLVGAGVGPTADANAPDTDLEGQVRSGATCDIGADELGPFIGPDTLHEEE